MANFSIPEIARVTRAGIHTQTPDEPTVQRFLFDSRKLTTARGTMFVAIAGKHHDGHDHINELYNRGVRSFLVSRPVYLPGPGNLLLTRDSLKALQNLASSHRSGFEGEVIAITGSNGKTVVKEWLFQVLAAKMSLTRSPRSYNSQLGVALSLLQLEAYHEKAIIEAGISQKGEMSALESMIRPEIGIFTAQGPAHDENFSSREEKLQEKLLLFKGAKVIIYPSDDELLSSLVEQSLPPEVMRFSWGKKGSGMIVHQREVHEEKTIARVEYQGEECSIDIPFLDNASVMNALTTAATLLYLGMDRKEVSAGISNLQAIEMRLQLKEGLNGCSIINDSYSSDLMSLEVALDFLAQQDARRKRVVILSDILQSGMPDEELYENVSTLCRAKGVSRLIGIGPAISAHQELFKGETDFYPSTREFLDDFPLSSFRDNIILFKGARTFGFERIVGRLQRKAHETVLRINLNALAHNLKYYQSLLSPGTRTMAMIKAFAYGSGTAEIASLLQFHQVDYLAVAYVDEGYELRNAGIEVPVMVMNPDSESLVPAIRRGLEPEIYGMGILEDLLFSINRYADIPSTVRIHIKIDSGMHRLGFLPSQVDALAEKLSKKNNVKVVSVFTHLAASEDPEEDAFTEQQVQTFLDCTRVLEEKLGYPLLKHVLNSAGIRRFPQYHLDMVRLGIGLYGVSADEREQAFLQNVSTLRTIVSQIKEIRAGDSVGYNRGWKAQKDSRIAVIPVGYADGYDMRFGNGTGEVIIRDKAYPVVGKVCMDMCMVDVSGSDVEEGDEAVVFGEGISVKELAGRIGTIPYEILTGISSRVKRIYYYE